MRSRKNYDPIPAEATNRDRAMFMREQARGKKNAGSIEGKFRLRYEEYPGRWTDRFFRSEEKRDEFIEFLTCNYKIM